MRLVSIGHQCVGHAWIQQDLQCWHAAQAYVPESSGMGTDPNITADLTALQRMLCSLEAGIAAVRPGKAGFTQPGRFLWQLLGRAGISQEACPLMVMLLVTAGELLTSQGADDAALGRCAGQE